MKHKSEKDVGMNAHKQTLKRLAPQARKWAGIFEGPHDLSSNPAYMEGFGQDSQQLSRNAPIPTVPQRGKEAQSRRR